MMNTNENYDIIAKGSKSGTKYPPIEPDSYPAICYAIIDIGTQYNQMFDNSSQKVILMWELPTERIEVEKDGIVQNLPRAISAKYTLSLSDKANLRKVLESWRGKTFTEEELNGFNLRNVLGAKCMLTVVNEQKQNGDTFSKVGAVVKLPKMFAENIPAKAENPLVMFSTADPQFLTKMKTLPEWIQKQIQESEEYKAAALGKQTSNGFETVSNDEGDLPF